MKFYTSLVCLLFLCNGYSQYSYNGSNKHTFQTDFGNIELGPMSSTWAHIYTDRPKIIFNKDVYTTSNAFSSYDNDLILKTKGTERFRILDDNGNVGIGTSNPRSTLSLESTNDAIMSFKTSDGGWLYTSWLDEKGARRLWMGLNNDLSSFNINVENATTKILFNGGNVGIGTRYPDAKLAVKGRIHAQEVKLDLNGSVAPDYVFKEGYDLKTLEEVKAHIQSEGHLPNIPSANEMERDGINLKEMNLKLLEKIEELTLYVIDQNERIKKLEQENKKLKQNE